LLKHSRFTRRPSTVTVTSYPTPRSVQRDIARRTIRTLIRMLVALVVVLLITMLLVAEPLKITGVRIDGIHTIPRERVEMAASALIGQNIFMAKTRIVRRQLVSMLEIQDARVRRSHDLKVDITVVERMPFTALPPPDNLLSGREQPASPGTEQLNALVDAEGLVYRFTEDLPRRVPLLRCDSSSALRVGQRVPRTIMKDVHECLKCVHAGGLPTPSEILRTEVGAITLRFPDGLSIRIGHDDWRAKLKYATRALHVIKGLGQEAKSLDLRSLEAPIWTPKGAPADEKAIS